MSGSQRLAIAFGLFAVLGLLAWLTLRDEKLRLFTLVLLGFFALRTWIASRRTAGQGRE